MKTRLRAVMWGVAGLLGLLPASRAQDPPPNNLVYHLFVRSWADSPGDPDEVGDLAAIRDQLDYLNDGKPETDDDLEVGILWLMPIFPSPSYHGYDVTDFREVDPEYGSMGDLEALIGDAHARGMRVILDLPLNHTSDEHPWFRQAVDDPASPFRKFYHFAPIDQPAPPGAWHVATASDGRKVRYFGLFSPDMPDLDLSQPEVREEVTQVARFWLAKGVDGFRLDAAKHVFGDTFGAIPEPDILRNNDWWRAFSDACRREDPDAVLVGEVLGDPEALRRHAYGLDALLDAPFLHAARGRVAFPRSGFLAEHRDLLRRCREVNEDAHRGPGAMPPAAPFMLFPFLASHDESPRLASFLEEQKRHGMRAEVDQAYRVGMYLLASVDAHPVLYQGDELMQRGFKWNGNPPHAHPPGDGSGLFDETLREPFPWRKAGDDPAAGDGDLQTQWSDQLPKFDGPDDGVSVEEQAAPGGMLHLVRGLANLRTRHPAFANGEIGEILNDSPEWLVFEKVAVPGRHLVLINTTGGGLDYNFHEGWFPRYVGAALLFWSDGASGRWKDESGAGRHIGSKVFVPPLRYGGPASGGWLRCVDRIGRTGRCDTPVASRHGWPTATIRGKTDGAPSRPLLRSGSGNPISGEACGSVRMSRPRPERRSSP